MKVPTPSVTLNDLFKNALPESAFLVCGDLNVRVSWARILTSQATSLASAAEGDLVLIPFQTLMQNQEPDRDLSRIISQLALSRIRVVAIQGKISIAALETAARSMMAVIYLPEIVAIEGIETAITRYINDERSKFEKRDTALQQELTRYANSNSSIYVVLKSLARLVGLPVVLHDAQGFRLAYGLPDEKNSKQWEQHLALLQNSEVVAHFSDRTQVNQQTASILESMLALSAAISVDSAIAGYLSIVKCGQPLDDFSVIALTRGSSACGLMLAKNRIEQPRNDWITAWLDGHIIDEMMLAARSEQTNFDPEQVYVISVMRWLPDDDPRRATKIVRPEQLTEQVRHETTLRRINAIIGQYRDRTLLFLPLEKAQHTGRMKQYTTTIAKRLSEVFGGVVGCGVGRPALGLAELRHSFLDADRAMNLSEQLWKETHASFFGDLSLTELLMNIKNHHQLMRFCNDWLHSILEYDQQNNSDLLLTMSVYFGNNGNMAATAKQLNVHRNTLVYRLNRIAEITQLDMDDADVQLNLHLAIKAYQLLERLELD